MSGAYIGSGSSKKIKELYVGAGNLSKKIKKAYIGVSKVAKVWWISSPTLKSYSEAMEQKYRTLAGNVLGANNSPRLNANRTTSAVLYRMGCELTDVSKQFDVVVLANAGGVHSILDLNPYRQSPNHPPPTNAYGGASYGGASYYLGGGNSNYWTNSDVFRIDANNVVTNISSLDKYPSYGTEISKSAVFDSCTYFFRCTGSGSLDDAIFKLNSNGTHSVTTYRTCPFVDYTTKLVLSINGKALAFYGTIPTSAYFAENGTINSFDNSGITSAFSKYQYSTTYSLPYLNGLSSDGIFKSHMLVPIIYDYRYYPNTEYALGVIDSNLVASVIDKGIDLFDTQMTCNLNFDNEYHFYGDYGDSVRELVYNENLVIVANRAYQKGYDTTSYFEICSGKVNNVVYFSYTGYGANPKSDNIYSELYY